MSARAAAQEQTGNGENPNQANESARLAQTEQLRAPTVSDAAEARNAVTEVHVAAAGVISRNAARLVDMVCLTAIVTLVMLLAEAVTGADLFQTASIRSLAAPLCGLFAALSFAYFTLFHAMKGRTPGKWVTGIYVLDDTGRPPSLGRSLIRTCAAFVSAALLFGGFFAALFSKHRQTLHDRLSGTHVVWLIRID